MVHLPKQSVVSKSACSGGLLGEPTGRRLGLTLSELLIALSITLVILLAMMRAFTVASRDIGAGRNRVLLAERIRTASDLIRTDLEKLSLDVRPFLRSTESLGYFEMVDGAYRDMTFSNVPQNSLLGDIDDVLMFTAKSLDQPFRGRFDGNTIESNEAEIIYFTRLDRDNNQNGRPDYGDLIRLYRRVLLVRPDVDVVSVLARSATAYDLFVDNNSLDPLLKNRTPYAKFLQFNDVSLHLDLLPTPQWRPNSLSTLTHPRNRTAHATAAVSQFHPILNFDGDNTDADNVIPGETMLGDLVLQGVAAGSDVVLENIVAFDLKVFDNTAPVYPFAGQSIVPHDPGYDAVRVSGVNQDGSGTFVDLGAFEFRTVNGLIPSNNTFVGLPENPIAPIFGGNTAFAFGAWRNRLGSNVNPAVPAYHDAMLDQYQRFAGGPTYTTWTSDFENDGLDFDGDGLIDEGEDGIPLAAAPVPDSGVDVDALPPYSIPLSSIQVTIRIASFDADREQISGGDQVIQAQIVASTANQ